MTTNGKSVVERRDQTRSLIEKLLTERRELLALLFYGSPPDSAAGAMERDRLKEFCQILVDYIAAGHFGLYQRISEGNERRASVLTVAEQVYPRIESITHAAVCFSDQCEANNYEITDELTRTLSGLAEDLSTRFDLEDRIIEGILSP